MKVVIDRKQLQHAAEMAALSEHVYLRDNQPPPGDWKVLQTSDDLMPGKRSFFGALYTRTDPQTQEKEYVFAFRGSDGNDLKSNFAIAAGRLPVQFAHALQFVKRACEVEGIAAEKAEITGHSLGGYLARTIGLVLVPKKVWAFSSPGPNRETREMLESLAPKNALPNDKIVHIRSKHDIIGLLGTEEKIVLELDTKKQHHSIMKIKHHLQNAADPMNADKNAFKRKPGFLERVFNAVSAKLSSSQTLVRALRRLAGWAHKDNKGITVIPMSRPAFA